MADRPIIFSGPMVKALLAGTKTQTRRVISRRNVEVLGTSWAGKTWPWGGLRFSEAETREGRPDCLYMPFCHPDDEPTAPVDCGVYRVGSITQPGDRLWCRESGHLLHEAFDHDPRSGEDVWRVAGFRHAADGHIVAARPYDPPLSEWIDDCSRISRPSIFMPRWASRITLTVTDVRVQRLQGISEEDAIAEGVDGDPDGMTGPFTAYSAYGLLWDSINAKRGHPWSSNPWVIALTFSVEPRNIDAPSTGEQS